MRADSRGTILALLLCLLAHEKLDVYRCSIEFLAIAMAIVDALPRGHASLADQLKRGAMSVPLNIAEAAGKPTTADKKRFSGMARGSAMECGAILDVCSVLGVAGRQEIEQGKRLLVRVVSMLTKMCR